MKMTTVALFATVVSAAGCAPPIRVQPQEIHAGDVVRASFHSRSDALRDVVVTQRNRDGIIVRPSTGESDSTILFAELSRLQVQRPPNRIAGSLSGGGLGLLAGVLLGAAFGSVAGDGPNFAPVGGALIGLPTGLVLGAILAPTRWAEVSLR